MTLASGTAVPERLDDAIQADERLAAATPTKPFDPRTEVSADAKYVVRNLVLWFLVFPPLLALLVWALSNALK
jgi:hypothetical protein